MLTLFCVRFFQNNTSVFRAARFAIPCFLAKTSREAKIAVAPPEGVECIETVSSSAADYGRAVAMSLWICACVKAVL